MDYLNDSDEEEMAEDGKKRKRKLIKENKGSEDSRDVSDNERSKKKSNKRIRFSLESQTQDVHKSSYDTSCDPVSHDPSSSSSNERQCYNIPQKRDTTSNNGLGPLKKKVCGLLNRYNEV